MQSEKGFSLIEVIVGVAIMASVGLAILAALGGASKVLLSTDTKESARDLAQAQMEYVQRLPYSATSPYTINMAIDSEYPGYSTSILTPNPPLPVRDGVQDITVVVSQGAEEKFRLVGRKIDW